MRVGYMSHSFSLYEELSVRANLDLHAGVDSAVFSDLAAGLVGLSAQAADARNPTVITRRASASS